MARKIIVVIGITIALLFVIACGYREGVLQKEAVSYIWFTGNVNGAMASIDNGEPFALQASDYPEDASSRGKSEAKYIHYKLSPGKHRITVKKQGQVVVDRIVILENENIKEIDVP